MHACIYHISICIRENTNTSPPPFFSNNACTLMMIVYPRETPPHTRAARAQPPAAHRRRHSRPYHRRHGEHSPTARQPHSNGLCSPPKEGPGPGSALRHMDAGPSTLLYRKHALHSLAIVAFPVPLLTTCSGPTLFYPIHPDVKFTRSIRTSRLRTRFCQQPIGGIESFSFVPLTREPGPPDQCSPHWYAGGPKLGPSLTQARRHGVTVRDGYRLG